jgi:hypothetical protein
MGDRKSTTVNPLEGIEDSVLHFLYQIEKSSKGQVVDELHENVEEDVLKDVRIILFAAAKNIYVQTLIDQAYIQEGEDVEIDLVQRRKRDGNNLLGKDIVDLYEYTNGYMEMFPKSVIGKKGKYIEVKSRAQIEMSVVSKQDELKDLSDCLMENRLQEQREMIGHLTSDRDADRKWIQKLEQATVQLEHHIIDLKDTVARMQRIVSNLISPQSVPIPNNSIPAPKDTLMPNVSTQSIWDIDQNSANALVSSNLHPAQTQQHSVGQDMNQHNKGQPSMESCVVRDEGHSTAPGKVTGHLNGVTVAHISSQQGDHTTVLYKHGAEDKFINMCKENGETVISKRVSPGQSKQQCKVSREQQTSPVPQGIEKTDKGSMINAQRDSGQWPTPAETYANGASSMAAASTSVNGYQHHQQHLGPRLAQGATKPATMQHQPTQPLYPQTAMLRLPNLGQSSHGPHLPPYIAPHTSPPQPDLHHSASRSNQQVCGSVQHSTQSVAPPVQQGHQSFIPGGRVTIMEGQRQEHQQGYPQGPSQSSGGPSFILQGRKQERGSFLYLQNIYVENETNAVISRSLVDYA